MYIPPYNTYVHTNLHMYMCVYTHVYIHVCVRAYMCVCVRACVCVCVCVCSYVAIGYVKNPSFGCYNVVICPTQFNQRTNN